jgi:predicted nucleic acid-binding protein
MPAEVFLDTNIVVYAYDSDAYDSDAYDSDAYDSGAGDKRTVALRIVERGWSGQ